MRSLRNVTLATRLYGLVALVMLVAGVIVLKSLQQVHGTEGVLEYTIDNRMSSQQDLQLVSDALTDANDHARAVVDRSMSAAEAQADIAPSVAAAHDAWDKYFLAEMIVEEQALADQTTPLLDKAYLAIERLQDRLRSGSVAGLEEFRVAELRPAIVAARDNLRALSAMQMVAAKRDQERAAARSSLAARQVGLLLAAGLALASILACLIVRAVMKRLGADPAEAARVAQRIADGDYRFAVDARGAETSLLGALSRMKDGLLRSKMDYEGQLDAIGKVQAVVEFSTDGIVLAANDVFLKAVGYKLEDVLGQHHRLFVDAADRDGAAYRDFWSALTRGEAQNGQYRRIARDGREVWLQCLYNPILDADGKPFKIVKYGTDVTEARQAAQINAAFRGALGTLSANVIVAETTGQIVYMNASARELMKSIEADLQRDLPGLRANRLIGQSIDVLSLDPAAQRRLFDGLTDTQVRDSVIGGRTLRVIVSPMLDESGRRLGTVTEWFDRTQQVATERELQTVIDAVSEGDLSRRIGLEDKSGSFETLSRGINGLVDNVEAVVDEVQQLVAAANSGDLTRRVAFDGKAGLIVKVGSGLNKLTDNMASLVAKVKSAAGEVSRGADEISQGNTNLSQRTEEQASSLEQTASSMEQMTSTVKQNADNAGQANQLAVAARDQAERGGAVVAKAVRAMADINDASKKIADIIGVIDEIAFQTNLLALNAAVEAARAGEQGRGFAVVASEVRNLAGRSATAAKEIKALIQDSVRKVDEGSSLVTQSGATLDQIVAAVKKVTDIVAEIAAASNEQSAGIDQVSKAVMQLDELTQQNAALVEQASAASQAMAEQARGLNERMSAYRVDAALAMAATSRAAAKPAADERRKGPRPWTRKSSPEAASGASTGTNDEVWKEF